MRRDVRGSRWTPASPPAGARARPSLSCSRWSATGHGGLTTLNPGFRLVCFFLVFIYIYIYKLSSRFSPRGSSSRARSRPPATTRCWWRFLSCRRRLSLRCHAWHMADSLGRAPPPADDGDGAAVCRPSQSAVVSSFMELWVLINN